MVTKRKSFSLLSLVLLVLVVALILPQVLLTRKLAVVERQLRRATAAHGHIDPPDGSFTYINCFYSNEHSSCSSSTHSIRVLAWNSDYLLHLTEWENREPEIGELVPTQTVRKLEPRIEKVISICGHQNFRVEIKNETVMTYEKPENAHSPVRMNRFAVRTGRQIQFHPDERIPLYHSAWKLSPSQSKGGVVVWLESRKEWTERRRAAALNQGER